MTLSLSLSVMQLVASLSGLGLRCGCRLINPFPLCCQFPIENCLLLQQLLPTNSTFRGNSRFQGFWVEIQHRRCSCVPQSHSGVRDPYGSIFFRKREAQCYLWLDPMGSLLQLTFWWRSMLCSSHKVRPTFPCSQQETSREQPCATGLLNRPSQG